LEKTGRSVSEEVLFALFISQRLPKVCPINSAVMHSLECSINVVQNMWAMFKDSYGEICKYLGIDKVKNLIRIRQEKIISRYCRSSNLFMSPDMRRL